MDSSPFRSISGLLWQQKSLPLGEALITPAMLPDLTPIPSQAETSPCAEEVAANKDIESAGQASDGHNFLPDHIVLKDTISQNG